MDLSVFVNSHTQTTFQLFIALSLGALTGNVCFFGYWCPEPVGHAAVENRAPGYLIRRIGSFIRQHLVLNVTIFMPLAERLYYSRLQR